MALTVNAQTIAANGTKITLGGADDRVVSRYAIQITGTFTATIQFEVSLDGGTTYVAALATPVGSTTAATTTTAAGAFLMDVSGFPLARLNCTAYTSGTATVYAQPVLG